MKYSRLVLILSTLAPGLVEGATYTLTDNWVGPAFLDAFMFQNIRDPTHGRVNYVDKDTALAKNLTYATNDSFVLQADSTTVLHPDGPGRDSVRIMTYKTYTTHVAVFDIRHMPQGCGTWPAVWQTTESNWPYGGEVDILEGVNDCGTNAVTLHTGPGCTMPQVRPMLGIPTYRDCNAFVNYNAGCGVELIQPQSYGPTFNRVGGGWYAMERTNSFIKVWFWSRHDPTVPWAVKHGDGNINTDLFGIPSAYFPDDYCDIASHFGEHHIIINLTFCGDWAGNVYDQSGCPGTCIDFVNNNPSAFRDAYFDIAAVRVYQ
ncbi:hypothetical protein AX16_001672 [Volvariella volvacea WC 439]|nr:hypothetical protein AX16_001672 [Volvariella volvacea WC 439]